MRSALPGRLYDVFRTTSATSGSATSPPSPTGSARSTSTCCRDGQLPCAGSQESSTGTPRATPPVGHDMTRMLQSMKHRGPDSTGYALYRAAADAVRHAVKLADAHDRAASTSSSGSPRAPVEERLRAPALGVTLRRAARPDGLRRSPSTRRRPEGARRRGRGRQRDAEVLSIGTRWRSSRTSATRRVPTRTASALPGTHAIGHVRMATESDVDISGAHPYWAYPFSDIAVVHNGQLTNYFQWQRRLSATATASSRSATRRSSPSTSPRR